MATEWKSQQGDGKYRLQFETDSKEKYKFVEKAVQMAVDEKTTADIVEVKHGYWKDRFGDKYDNHLYECSVCGKKALYKLYKDELLTTKLEQDLTYGCPYCLAIMDGKDINVTTTRGNENGNK